MILVARMLFMGLLVFLALALPENWDPAIKLRRWLDRRERRR